MTTLLTEKRDLVHHVLSLFFQDQEVADYLQAEPKDQEALRVTVRIVVDFYYFLGGAPSEVHPSQPDVDYMNDTIRAGMDFFCDIRALERVLTNRKEREFEWYHYETFAALKADALLWFESLREESSSPQARFYALLVMIRLMLLFWTTTFME